MFRGCDSKGLFGSPMIHPHHHIPLSDSCKTETGSDISARGNIWTSPYNKTAWSPVWLTATGRKFRSRATNEHVPSNPIPRTESTSMPWVTFWKNNNNMYRVCLMEKWVVHHHTNMFHGVDKRCGFSEVFTLTCVYKKLRVTFTAVQHLLQMSADDCS